MIKILGEFVQNQLPDVETERLYLRERKVADAADMFANASLPEVATNAGFPLMKNVEEEEAFIQGIPLRMVQAGLPGGYGITLKGENSVIGSVDFNRRHGKLGDIYEVGYVLHPDYWGQGLVPEAVKALCYAAFTLIPELYKMEIACHASNLQSQAVAKKSGFVLEARLRGRELLRGQREDELRFGLLRSEWEELIDLNH
ncbi:GNAT family N-acetyltransferase [Streptococcus sp. 121]|uniref:GNAT family N-acetyltransferase n=1 Tax=Streptococcus sp. 121 TaxID=2797637 RepID=UPI0018F09842|nr:GNAT family protein [Streptococcus sp. 121]MBJ6745011.1 GNAT family N-acetyltransferase [Streptococcus sp. 121]